jgi:hypothetical protein
MTKISNQYSLTNVLTADVVNGRVGINNGSPTVALDVTGAGRLSSSLTTAGAIFTTNDSVFSTAGTITKHATVGLTIRGTTASVFDYSLYSAGGTALMTNPTGTNNINFNSGQVWFNGGAVGIGTSSPTFADGSGLHINNNSGSARLRLTNNTTGGTANDGSEFTVAGSDLYVINNENANMLFITNAAERMRIKSNGDIDFAQSRILSVTASSGYLAFYNNGGGIYFGALGLGNQMLFTAGGDLYIGATSITTAVTSIYLEKAGGDIVQVFPYSSGTSVFQFYYRQNGALVGTISYNGTNTLFNGTSDYRLKEDLKDYNGLEILSKLKTYNFNWKNTNVRDYGMIAHELQEVLPNYVTGEKNALNKDGSINPQGVDYSKIVPVLIKSIQEQQTQINELKALINA